MDTQAVLDTALAANATALGNGPATEYFREAVKGSYKVSVNLKPQERDYLRRLVPFPIVFTNTNSMASDHAIMAACRELARSVYEKCFGIRHTSERTLVIGAAMREISLYNSNPNIHFYVHGGEAKDVDRIVRPALLDIANSLKRKAAKSDRRVYLPHGKDKQEPRGPAKRYEDWMQILRDYLDANRLPPNIHKQPVQANTLVFEDSIYNFDRESLTSLFEETGALTAYGYALMPMELLFPDMPENRLYRFAIEGPHGEYARLTYRGGTSNGYLHRLSSWRMLLENPVIKHKGVYIVTEIVCRIGPMVVFKMMRAKESETIVRSIALSESETYVRLLDLPEMYDHETGALRHPLKYISVREEEFLDAANYMLSVDEKSRTLTNAMSYVRRRMGGMSLVARELVAPWDLPKKHVTTFSLVVTAWVNLQMGSLAKYADPDNYTFASWWDSIKSRWAATFRISLRERYELLFSLLCKHRVEEELVLTPDNERLQFGEVIKKRPPPLAVLMGEAEEEDRSKVSANLYLDFANEEDMPSCEVCLALHGQLGQQIVVCGQKDDTYHDFSLTEAQLGHLKTQLLDTDGDPASLASVKKRALEALPNRPFTQRARVRYLRAGPGCGKSYIIRKLADENDLVMAPFTKLKTDYENLTNRRGDSYNLTFKTTHRAMETKGHARIFLDEFTSMSYDILACTVYNNAATEVFLVGDDKQTCIQEPTEGLYIGNYINLASLDVHDLVVNFRNPPDTVALLNKMFGYKMRSAKTHTGTPSIEFVRPEQLPGGRTALTMCFSKAAAKKITEDERNTVRSNQGGTYPVVKLHLTSEDGTVPDVESLQVVALSRHSEKLYIVCDDSGVSDKFRAKFDLGQEWQDTYGNHLKFSDSELKSVDVSDEVISRVLAGVDSEGPGTSSSSDSDPSDTEGPGTRAPKEERVDLSRDRCDQGRKPRRSRPERPVPALTSDDDSANAVGIAAFAGSLFVAALRRRHRAMVEVSKASSCRTLASAGSSTSGIGSSAGTSPGESLPSLTPTSSGPEVAGEAQEPTTSTEASAAREEDLATNSDPGVNSSSSEETSDGEGNHQSDFEQRVRTAVAELVMAASECSCARLRDVDLADNFRVHPTDTRKKIDQLIPVVVAGIDAQDPKICILGGAAREGDKVVKMATPAVKEHFSGGWWSVDPRFAGGDRTGTRVRGDFRQLGSTNATHVFFSDMYVQSGTDSTNNLLDDVVEWYRALTPDTDWAQFRLVHKLTWSTTDVPSLAKVLGKSVEWRFYRPLASGPSSEYFVYIKGLRQREADVPEICCSVAARVNDLYGHVQNCEGCLNGRLLELAFPLWSNVAPWDDVKTNCSMTGSGNPADVYKIALNDYRRTGYAPGQRENHAKGQRNTDWFTQTYPKMTPRNVGSYGRSESYSHTYDWPLPVESRQETKDTVVSTEVPDSLKYLDSNADFSVHAQTWMAHPRMCLRDYDRLPMVRPVPHPLPQTSRDPHLYAGELVAKAATTELVTSWNWYQSQIVRGKFGTGRIQVDQVLAPTNARKHPINLTEKYYSAGPGMGLHYSAKKPCQTLAVMETRYLNIRKGFPFGYKEILMAREIVDLWFEEHVLPPHQRPDIFTDDDIDKAYSAYLRDAQSKGYATRYSATMADDGPEGRTVRFHLKTIFKPKLKPDLYKVGQGISAWSVQTLAMFCSVFRVLTGTSLKIEKKYIVTDAYWSETQFVDYINKVMRDVPSVAPFGVTDGEMFDACQNAFTQELEKHYLRRIGLSEEIIAHYYSFRAGYFLKASCVEGRAGTQKTSGEPGTLYNNGVVSRMISNWLLRGDGPCVIIYKGDDFVKRQCNLWADMERKAQLDSVCALKIRINISSGAEFCGLVLEQGFMFPSIVRKLNKATSHRFRDYEHFCKYQAALRDWVDAIGHFGAERVIGFNANMYATSYQHVESMFEAVRGLSHINKAQFESMFGFCQEPATVPIMHRELGRVVMIEA